MMTWLICLALGDERVDRLCRDLGAEAAETRERAMTELVAIGKPAVPGLRALFEHPDAEVRGRAKSAVDLIRRELKKTALRLSVKADPARAPYREPVRLRLTLSNVEDFPIVVPAVPRDSGFGAELDVALSAAGRRMIVGNWDGMRSLAGRSVDESRFLTLRPGESVELDRRVIETVAPAPDLGGAFEGSVTVKFRPPPPGLYDIAAVFTFQPREPFEIADGARGLFKESWTGSLKAETRFEISGSASPSRP